MSEDVFFNVDDINLENKDLLNLEEEETKETITTSSEDENISSSTEIDEETKEKQEETNNGESTNTEGTPSSEDNSSHSSSTLYALAKYLKEEGVLYLEDELKEVESLEDLKALIAKSNDAAKYANLNESQKRFQEALATGLPQKEYEKIEKEIQTFESIQETQVEEDENLRYEIIALDLIDKGLDQEKAIKLAKLSLNDETNVQDAKEALKNLVEKKRDNYKKLIEDKKEETEVNLEKIKTAVESKKDILGMSLNDMTKNKLFDYMTTKVANDDNGLPMNKLQAWQKENPIESNILLNYLFMITNEGKDLNQLTKTTTSKVTKELENRIRSLNFDKDGNLVIPQEFTSGKTNSNNKKDSENLTINI